MAEKAEIQDLFLQYDHDTKITPDKSLHTSKNRDRSRKTQPLRFIIEHGWRKKLEKTEI